ncbi:MAG: valine--tRNA ligase, partial [Bryobacteraceae bacterium]
PISISLAPYPCPEGDLKRGTVDAFLLIKAIVTAARELRADHKLDAKAIYAASLSLPDRPIDPEDLGVVEKLARLNLSNGQISAQAAHFRRSGPNFDLTIHVNAAASNGTGAGETRARLEKENAELRKAIGDKKRQLGNEEFVRKAPAKVVQGLEAKLAEYETQLAKNERLLGGL